MVTKKNLVDTELRRQNVNDRAEEPCNKSKMKTALVIPITGVQQSTVPQLSILVLTALSYPPFFRSYDLMRIFFPVESYRDITTGTLMATPPDAWRCRVSTWAASIGASILRLLEIASFICNFHLSVAARTIAQGDLSLRYTLYVVGMLSNQRKKQTKTNKQAKQQQQQRNTPKHPCSKIGTISVQCAQKLYKLTAVASRDPATKTFLR